MNNNNVYSTSRTVWADTVRLIAILMIITVHCSDAFANLPVAKDHLLYKEWAIFYAVISRVGVPLFVMLTGMLLLPVRQEPSLFYKKRIIRVLVPFLLWSVFYNLIPFFCGLIGINGDVLSSMFICAGKNPPQSLGASFWNIIFIPFRISAYTIHLWYVYMLIGLYLYMPIFSIIIQHSTKRYQNIFLALWGLTLLHPYLNEWISDDILGHCEWNPFGMLYYFAGFNGYLLLGYRLKEKNTENVGKTILIAMTLILIGNLMTYWGFHLMTDGGHATSRQAELFFQYCSLNVAMSSIGSWLLLQQIPITSLICIKTLANLTKSGFGIYLVHYLFVGLVTPFGNCHWLPINLRIPFAVVAILLISWAFTFTISKLFMRTSKWIIG